MVKMYENIKIETIAVKQRRIIHFIKKRNTKLLLDLFVGDEEEKGRQTMKTQSTWYVIGFIAAILTLMTLPMALAKTAGAISPENFEKKLLRKNDDHLQKVLNCLLILVATNHEETPLLINQFLQENSNQGIEKAHHDALKIIVTTCGLLPATTSKGSGSENLDKTNSKQASSSLTKPQEVALNEWYKTLYAKLSARHRKILYGVSRGRELPTHLTF